MIASVRVVLALGLAGYCLTLAPEVPAVVGFVVAAGIVGALAAIAGGGASVAATALGVSYGLSLVAASAPLDLAAPLFGMGLFAYVRLRGEGGGVAFRPDGTVAVRRALDALTAGVAGGGVGLAVVLVGGGSQVAGTQVVIASCGLVVLLSAGMTFTARAALAEKRRGEDD